MKRLVKRLGWTLAVLAGVVALAIGALFAVNATDEPLSAEAQAALKLPPVPPHDERNGYVDFLAFDALSDRRIRACSYGSTLACVAADPTVKDVLASHAAFFARYRAMREKPEFADLYEGRSPEDPLPNYQGMTNAHRLSLLHAALEFNAGRRAAALAELEADFVFYRRVATGSRILITKMIAFAMLDSNAIFAAELARKLPAHERAQWARLQAMLRAPTRAELDLAAVLERERGMQATWMSTRQHVRLSEAAYEVIRSFDPGIRRIWWDPVAPWLYRPHYSVNKFVAQSLIMQSVVGRPGTEFFAAQREARSRAKQLDGPVWQQLVLSPAVTFHYLFTTYDLSDYVGRAHATAGVQALAGLQASLRASQISRPEDVARALAGPLGRRYLNPFTGQPMDFDREKMTLGFACEEKLLTGVARSTIFAGGKVALPL